MDHEIRRQNKQKTIAILYNVELKLDLLTTYWNIQNILLKLKPQNDNSLMTMDLNEMGIFFTFYFL